MAQPDEATAEDIAVVEEAEEIGQIVDRLLSDEPLDIEIDWQGSLVLLRPLSEGGKQWLAAYAPEDAPWFGSALCVEPRFLHDFIARMIYDFIAFE